MSKLKMVKNEILPSIKIGAIFQNSKWLKNGILPPVKVGAIFENSARLKIQVSATFSKNRCCMPKLKMVKKTKFYLQQK